MRLKTENKAGLSKRLLPLYVAGFLQGFVLWYAIERLFMVSIGFNDATIGLTIAIYSAVMLLADAPAGILADRWSRKGVLMLAGGFLALASLLGGLSHSPLLFIISEMFWGIYFALYSGTYDSIIYDTVIEETGSATAFKKYYGRYYGLDSIGLVLGSLLGGFLASAFHPRAMFFITAPFAILSVIVLLWFREPQLHKKKVAVPIKEHITSTFKAVLSNKAILPILLVLLLEKSLIYMMFGFGQVWLVALAAPTLFFGISAAALSATGLGGTLVSNLKIQEEPGMLSLLTIMFASVLGLIWFRNIIGIFACQLLFGTGLVGIGIVFTSLLHDSLGAHIRTGSASVVSALSRGMIIPLALVFGYVSKRYTIFDAAWMLFGLFAIMSVYALKGLGVDGKS